MGRLDGRVVAITGASAGIGRATAERVAAEGGAVVVSARREALLAELVAAIRGRGGRAIAVAADVTIEADADRLVTATIEAFGRLDVMICNAGIGYHGTLEEATTAAMRRVVDVNVMGTLYTAHAAMRAMRRQGSGHIIAVSSIVGRRGVGGSSVYAATKGAQVAFIESLRADFVGTPFHASVVLPVATETEFHAAIERDFGYSASGVGPRQSAAEVAAAIADTIASPKAEVYPFRKAWWLAVLGVVAPARADKVVARFKRRRQ